MIKIILFFTITAGLGALTLSLDHPSSTALDEQTLRTSLADSHSKQSLGGALTAVMETPNSSLAIYQPRNSSVRPAGVPEFASSDLPSAPPSAAGLGGFPSAQLAFFARQRLDYLKNDQYAERDQILQVLETTSAHETVPGMAELVHAELNAKVLNSPDVPDAWKMRYTGRLMALRNRLPASARTPAPPADHLEQGARTGDDARDIPRDDPPAADARAESAAESAGDRP